MPRKSKDVQKENAAAIVNANNRKDDSARASTQIRKGPLGKIATKKSASLRKRPTLKSGAQSERKAPFDEEIRLRAYFLAEKRARLSLPGDTHSDWLEAKRQLLEEASLSSS